MNYYPNEANYVLPSFAVPVTPPDAPADGGVCIKVQYNPDWQAILFGAMSQMQMFGSWAGTDEDKDWGVANALLLMELLATPIIDDAETPFWDDGSDVGDSAPPDEQTWYGEVTNPTAPPDELTFEENLLLWVFTGLLAIATPEVGFAPAIAFHTLAPKFIVAQKRGDIATLIRIVLDGQDVALVDTTSYAPDDVVEIPIVGDPSLSSHNLLVINTLP